MRTVMDLGILVVVALVFVGLMLLKRASWVSGVKAGQLLQEGALVVDVRSPGEFHSAHLPRAVNIPIEDLRQVASRRLPDETRPLLLHCLSGARSGLGCRQLKALGYSSVFNLGSYRRAANVLGSGSAERP